jgi:hypothetical protein
LDNGVVYHEAIEQYGKSIGKADMSTRNIFNVADYGASGKKEEDAQPAIQRAIDECATAGGGMVYLPPGAYTSGTLRLRSHVRIFIEAGATVYSSKNRAAFTQDSLFWGEDLENVSLEGRGTIHGQATYEWRLTNHQDWYIYPNQVRWEKAGRPLERSFPTADSFGHLVMLVRCKDVLIRDLSFIDSPSWTIHPWGCERLVIENVYVSTSLKYGVWADGIDPDGCKDVRISNCTIETGDDALVFYSSSIFGPARACENITVTNCRLSSASSALKFCDGNLVAIRNVVIDNCIIMGSNRGIAFMVFDGGLIEHVIISNVTIECQRFDWYWWGDADPLHFNLIQRSEIDPNIDKSKERPVGAIRNVQVRNVFARGVGANLIHGHAQSPLENITLENIRLVMASDPNSPLQKGGDALTIENARSLSLRNVEITWEAPVSSEWKRALCVKNVNGLVLDNLSIRPAPDSEEPPAVFSQVEGLEIRNSRFA